MEKTDRIDAELPALYAERAELKVQQLPDEAIRRLRDLCTRRLDLLEMIDTERNRLEHASSAVRHEITSHIDHLRKRLKRTDRDLDGAVRSSELWRHQDQLLEGVPGGGPSCAPAHWPGYLNAKNTTQSE